MPTFHFAEAGLQKPWDSFRELSQCKLFDRFGRMYTFIDIFILLFLILLSSYCYCHIVTTKARLPSAVLPLLSDIDSIHSPDEPSDLVASYHVLIRYTFFFSAHEYKIVNNFETT